MAASPPSLDVERLARALRAGERTVLSRAITLIESKRADHRRAAAALTQALLGATGKAVRVGITGAPGVGKSTMIDALGSLLTGQGHKVAVLAVDPSSRRTGGSILADKTRMARLANDANAFIRPSPASGTLGGVAAKTRETMLLCEAAGYDVVLVETVGVGQSEIAVADMTDFFLVLALPGAGDELQALKKGVVELADMIAVNKADGDNLTRAKLAASQYGAALHILLPRSPNWSPPVITCSALKSDGIETLWSHVLDHRRRLTASGELAVRRGEQQVKWMWTMLEERLFEPLRTDRTLKAALPRIEGEVAAGRLAPATRGRGDRRDAGEVKLGRAQIAPSPAALADLDTVPIAQHRLHEGQKRRVIGGIERQEARNHGRHDCLGGAARAVVAFDRDAEPLSRQRAAIDAFGAGLDENPRTEKLHDLGAKPAGAGNVPWLLRADLAHPRRRLGACRRQSMSGSEFGETTSEIFGGTACRNCIEQLSTCEPAVLADSTAPVKSSSTARTSRCTGCSGRK